MRKLRFPFVLQPQRAGRFQNFTRRFSQQNNYLGETPGVEREISTKLETRRAQMKKGTSYSIVKQSLCLVKIYIIKDVYVIDIS